MKRKYTHKEIEHINDILNTIKATRSHDEYLIALYAVANSEVCNG